MQIGVTKEIKRHEYRVGLTPTDAKAYAAHGHTVLVEQGAGEEAGFPDSAYTAVGARMVPDAVSLFAEAEMVVKVKEPQPSEYGCVETIKPTTHDAPTYIVDGIVHYGVANMPAAVALTSTLALTGATLRYGLLLAEHGLDGAAGLSRAIATGVNTYRGHLTCKGVAEAFELPATDIRSVI